MTGRALVLLAVDDEEPALAELAFLLGEDPRVGRVLCAPGAEGALRLLGAQDVDAVFLDIRLPGLSGVEFATALSRFARPPAVVFVTAYDGAAVDAFSLHAVDYLLKPVAPSRLAEAVRRVQEHVRGDADQSPAADLLIPVELAGVTRFLSRADVRYVEAQGDYARLHLADSSHLVRTPLAVLEEQWRPAGFVRIHRSYLVSLGYVRELRVEAGGNYSLRVGTVQLPVARRHVRELKDRLLPHARGGPR